jgi:hypothetical protein
MRGASLMADRQDQISPGGRIAWHVVVYAVAIVPYVFLSDSVGRNEALLRIMVFACPALAAIDVLRARQKARRG